MSVHKEPRGDGTFVYKVRWRQGGRNRAKVFSPARLGGPRKARRLADAWDVKMAELAATGDFASLDRGTSTLLEYEVRWWERYATQRLAPATLESYATILDLYILPRFGHWQLRDIQPGDIEDWIVAMRKAGRGAPTVRRACVVLQGILKHAVRDREIDSNPVAQVDKPRAPRKRKPIIVPPEGVEAIRAHLLTAGQPGDATLVSLLAYAGPRPESEGIALDWTAVGKRSITLDATKKHGHERTFALLQPLAADLADWRRARGHRLRGLVFPFAGGHVAPDGRPWSGDDWDNWRERVFRPAAKAAGLPATLRPRDLRNSYATLLIWEGVPLVKVAHNLGHTPTMCIDTYAGVFEDYDPADRKAADDQILAARAAQPTIREATA